MKPKNKSEDSSSVDNLGAKPSGPFKAKAVSAREILKLIPLRKALDLKKLAKKQNP